MPLAAILLGAILCDLAFRGTEHEFAQQLGKDFGGGSQFWSWAAAIGILGALGYVKAVRPVSTGLMTLVIVTLVLRNGGMFDELKQLITSPPQAAPPVPLSQYKDPSSSSSSSSSSSGGGSVLGMLGGSGGGGASSMLGLAAEFGAFA